MDTWTDNHCEVHYLCETCSIEIQEGKSLLDRRCKYSFTVMEKCYFSYASLHICFQCPVSNLPLPFSIITCKHISLWYKFSLDSVWNLWLTCFNGNLAWQIIWLSSIHMNIGAKLCEAVLLQRRHFGVTLHPINRKHMVSLLVSRLLCLFFYTV